MSRTHTERFDLRLLPADADSLRWTAEEMGISQAEVIRRGIARVRSEHVLRQAERNGGKRAQGGAR